VSAPTISRELKLNKGQKGYRPKQAQIKADKRKKQAAKALKMTPALIILANHLKRDKIRARLPYFSIMS